MKRFLIVENDDVQRNLLGVMIQRRHKDAKIDYASNGSEALIMGLKNDYSAILSDINMPVMDGIDFHKKLKEKRPEASSSFACISASLHGSNLSYIRQERLLSLSKPFTKDDFNKLVDSLLQNHECKGLADNGICNKRGHERISINKKCSIECMYRGPAFSFVAETTDYSEGGLCMRYEGIILQTGTELNVEIEDYDIMQREAMVVWSKPDTSGSFKAGLRWV
jgi:CheY-like chemotaxis protein